LTIRANVISLNPLQILLPADQRTTAHVSTLRPSTRCRQTSSCPTCGRSRCGSTQIRQPNLNNVDIALIKDTRITEGKQLQFRAEALNAFNHPILSSNNTNNIITNVTSATFGQIVGSTQAGYPRPIQLTLKYIF
jgi:hypothetical protein